MLNEFTVNGSYAGSLEMAAELKQNSNAIVEVIAPEDIGVLPDVSIADDLVRLTGLTSERVNGRNQEITIRGLDPDFNVCTVDGVEQATTGDNRDAQYDQYPSELIGGATVYKTGQADMIGGIGGTVDLQFTSPLSVDHRVIAVDAFYNWTDLGQLTPGQKVAGESYSASYVDQFANGTEGIFVGYAHRENPLRGRAVPGLGLPHGPGRQPDPRRHEDLRPERAPEERLRRRRPREQAERLHPQQARPVPLLLPTTTSCCGAWRSRWRNGAAPVLQPGYTASGRTDHQLHAHERQSGRPEHGHAVALPPGLRDLEPRPGREVELAGASSRRAGPHASQTEEVLETYAGLGFQQHGDATRTRLSSRSLPARTPRWSSRARTTRTPASSPSPTRRAGARGSSRSPAWRATSSTSSVYDVADSYKVFTKHELERIHLQGRRDRRQLLRPLQAIRPESHRLPGQCRRPAAGSAAPARRDHEPELHRQPAPDRV